MSNEPVLPVMPQACLPSHQQAVVVVQEQLSLVQELLVEDLWHALSDLRQGESLVWRRRWAPACPSTVHLGLSGPCTQPNNNADPLLKPSSHKASMLPAAGSHSLPSLQRRQGSIQAWSHKSSLRQWCSQQLV